MKKWGNGPQEKQNVDTCVMCGRVVPEGTQVCRMCRLKVSNANLRVSVNQNKRIEVK